MLGSWNANQTVSLIRSGAKILGAVLVTLGVMNAGAVDSAMGAIESIGGAVLVLGGLFGSFWHHAP